jgi:hypothetical protein
MQQEAPEKFLGCDRHQSLLAFTCVVFPAEGYFAVSEIDDPMVGDGDAVRVASQILKDVLRPSEWPFGVDDPVMAIQRAEESLESFLFGQRFQIAGEAKLSEAKRAFQPGDELAPKNTAQHLHRQEEWITRMNPARMIC